jgi:4-hydroxybenzoate polyprenyltransferase
MWNVVLAARPRQWTKNLLVFAGLVFSGRFTDPAAVGVVLLTFAAFCLVSSAGYIFNDILDRESDSLHPKKKLRPIASGALAVSTAAWAAAILLAVGVCAAVATIPYLARTSEANYFALASIGVYALNQVFYATIARKVAIVDVFVIAFGFLIRAIAGALVLEVRISQWLILCTLFLALFLGFAKRKNEMSVAATSRHSLAGYSEKLVDQLIGICAAGAVIAYSLYAIQSNTAQAHPLLALTIPFPLFGVFRYLSVTYRDNDSGSPDAVLLRDPWIYGTILVWAAVSILAMMNPGWKPY